MISSSHIAKIYLNSALQQQALFAWIQKNTAVLQKLPKLLLTKLLFIGYNPIEISSS